MSENHIQTSHESMQIYSVELRFQSSIINKLILQMAFWQIIYQLYWPSQVLVYIFWEFRVQNRILSEERILLLLSINIIINYSSKIQDKMATLMQLSQGFPSIHETLSEISTQGQDEILNFCKVGSQEISFKIRQSNHMKVKSSLCKNFTQTGLCHYRDKCQFAHGTHELRCNAEVNVSYKTKYCNSFLNKKCCIYGFRCNFIHKDNTPINEQEKWNKIYSNYRKAIWKQQNGNQSRLLTILGQSS